MLRIYDARSGALVKRDPGLTAAAETVWFELIEPTPEEETFVEAQMGLDVPTRAEIREIEASSRFYQEDGGTFMTALLLTKAADQLALSSTLTFILKDRRLVTVCYAEPKSFSTFVSRAEKGTITGQNGAAILIGLIETLVQRTADTIEHVQDNVDKLISGVFNLKTSRRDSSRRLDVLLRATGREGDIAARVLESLTSLERTLLFFRDAAREFALDERTMQRIDVAQRDILSLMEHARFLSNRISFLLEATLGMITTEQNQIIKLFSVMSVMMMPPTLVASIYGMNFRFMPELEWTWGYPLALLMMVLAALIPFLYFRRRGWL